MKSFEYDGGRITLDVPSDWIEEIEEDERRLYYQDVPLSGGFRVRVSTYRGPEQVTSEAASEMLLGIAAKAAPEKKHEIVPLADGNVLVGYLQFFLEDDPPILMASWLVGIAVPPYHMQVASFTYTALAQNAGSPVVGEELKLLESCVHRAKYEVSIEDAEPPEVMLLHLQFAPTVENAPRHADLIVESARKVSKVVLDYTPASLHLVDTILEGFHQDNVPSDQIAETLFGFGCYVGEVIVRHANGRWYNTEETVMREVCPFPIIVQVGEDHLCNPIGKVFKRVDNGSEDNLPYFYQVFTGQTVPELEEKTKKPWWKRW